MARFEVGRARRHVHVFAVAEPQLMHAARGRARAVEERNRARLFRHRHVEQFQPGRLLPDLLRLIGDRQDVAGHLQRVRAHMRLRQVGLHHHFRLARIGDVDAGEILRRAFVRQPDDAAPVLGDLHRHAFAHAAEAAEIVLRQQLEIPGGGLAALAERIVGGGHSRLRCWRLLERPARMRRPSGYRNCSRDQALPACLRNSVRSALFQSGIALILFSLSRISAWCVM